MQKKHILIVEDDAVMQALLKKIISKEYQVTAMWNGLEALRWIQAGNMPDMIISDIKMPEMDGYELVKNIRNSGLYRDIPLLILSGEEDSTTRIAFYKLHINNFIVKPFNPDELLVLTKLIVGDLEMETGE